MHVLLFYARARARERERLQKQQYCILPPEVLLLSEFAMDHPSKEKRLALAEKTLEKDSDDNQEIRNCCSKETLPNQSDLEKKKKGEREKGNS